MLQQEQRQGRRRSAAATAAAGAAAAAAAPARPDAQHPRTAAAATAAARAAAVAAAAAAAPAATQQHPPEQRVLNLVAFRVGLRALDARRLELLHALLQQQQGRAGQLKGEACLLSSSSSSGGGGGGRSRVRTTSSRPTTGTLPPPPPRTFINMLKAEGLRVCFAFLSFSLRLPPALPPSWALHCGGGRRRGRVVQGCAERSRSALLLPPRACLSLPAVAPATHAPKQGGGHLAGAAVVGDGRLDVREKLLHLLREKADELRRVVAAAVARGRYHRRRQHAEGVHPERWAKRRGPTCRQVGEAAESWPVAACRHCRCSRRRRRRGMQWAGRAQAGAAPGGRALWQLAAAVRGVGQGRVRTSERRHARVADLHWAGGGLRQVGQVWHSSGSPIELNGRLGCCNRWHRR